MKVVLVFAILIAYSLCVEYPYGVPVFDESSVTLSGKTLTLENTRELIFKHKVVTKTGSMYVYGDLADGGDYVVSFSLDLNNMPRNALIGRFSRLFIEDYPYQHRITKDTHINEACKSEDSLTAYRDKMFDMVNLVGKGLNAMEKGDRIFWVLSRDGTIVQYAQRTAGDLGQQYRNYQITREECECCYEIMTKVWELYFAE